jgi:hypothetical protein
MTFGDLLEGGNGLWAISAAWLSCFMIYHVLRVRAQRKIPWRRLIFNFRVALSVQIALGTLAVALAIFLTRAVLWFARHYYPPDLDLYMPHSAIYAGGTALGIIGFLCILRSVSQPVCGHWPWVGALASGVAYIIWWAIDKFQ